jgi:hypothetical protein
MCQYNQTWQTARFFWVYTIGSYRLNVCKRQD